jgi:hypothetical protein
VAPIILPIPAALAREVIEGKHTSNEFEVVITPELTELDGEFFFAIKVADRMRVSVVR